MGLELRASQPLTSLGLYRGGITRPRAQSWGVCCFLGHDRHSWLTPALQSIYLPTTPRWHLLA